ncbi:putative cytochrome P450 E-class, group IV [Cladorrhinum sp. PSN259]|nr:putative cytochrome P450 E-class, group IV [Cladorrhinum sp. PSN259]
MAFSFAESLPLPTGLPPLPESIHNLIDSLPPLPPAIQTFLSSLTSIINSLPLPLSTLIPLLLITLYILSALIAHRRLSSFPGPPTTSFSYLWLILTLYSGQMGKKFTLANKKYGDTVRVGPNDLLTCDPSLIRRSSAARSRYTRSEWYKLSRLDPYDASMLNTLDGKLHDELKSKTAPGYSGRDSGGKTEQVVDKVLGTVIRVIRERYTDPGNETRTKKGKFLDLASMSQYFTLDSIAEVAFGLEWGLVEAEADKFGTIKMLDDIAPAAVVVSGVPYLRAVMGSDWVLKLVGPGEKDKKGVGRMMSMAKKVVAERFAPGAEDRNDMLGSFVRHGLTKRQCETEALIQIVAGSDTTATAIRATLLFIMTTPRVYNALREEIDKAVGSAKVSNPITNAEALELPYLQGVILEGLRLHPPFTGIPFKVVPPEGDTVDGKFIPGGTRVAPSIWATGRHKGVFGEDADVFRPERWVPKKGDAEESEQLAEMKRVAEMVFGYGRWGCAGKMIAFMELNKVFFELLRHFDFQLVYPYEPWHSRNHNLFLQDKMWVSVTDRATGSL